MAGFGLGYFLMCLSFISYTQSAFSRLFAYQRLEICFTHKAAKIFKCESANKARKMLDIHFNSLPLLWKCKNEGRRRYSYFSW
jgi:hypothetical protein